MELTNAQMLGSDLYLRIIEANGATSYTHHRVYDREKFLRCRREAIGKENGPRKIDVITRDEFKKHGGRE